MATSPTPWKIEKHGDDYELIDADGELLMADDEYYPTAMSLEDAEMVVALVNAQEKQP